MKTVITLCFLPAVIACNDGVADSPPVRAPELRNVAPSLESITVGEVSSAPDGYLAMAHLQPNSDLSACQDSDTVALRVATGTAPDATISSLCGDEVGGEVVLRACRDGERAIGDRGGVSSATGTPSQANGDGCYWCTSDRCLNNGALKQRKEGTIHPCIPDVWNSCCYAINGGCCS